jgi:hypothetical protein
MTPTDALIAAWVRWEENPRSRPVTLDRLAAIAALELDSNRTHDTIGAARRAGYSIPDAVQTAINQQAHREVA